MDQPAPACPICRTPLPPVFFNRGRFEPCPHCRAPVWIEAFPALTRPAPRGSGPENVLVAGESMCFYHDGKKAASVCDACGRFLCALCDCQLHGGHYCPNCLQSARKPRALKAMDNARTLYDRQAFVLSLAPLYLTGMAAVYIAIRYRKEPGSLVAPRRWMFPAALVLGLVQTLGFTALIALAIFG